MQTSSVLINTTLQAVALSTASNIIAQIIEAHRAQRGFALDLVQLIRFVIFTFVTAPPNVLWQRLLERTFPAYPDGGAPSGGGSDSNGALDLEKGRDDEREKKPGGNDGIPVGDGGGHGQPKLNIRNTLTKWFVDCITMGAIFNTVAFLVVMGILKGQPGGQIAANIRTETIPIIVAGYKMWPIASIISFSFIPVERRVVFLSFVGLLWGIYMSLVAARV